MCSSYSDSSRFSIFDLVLQSYLIVQVEIDGIANDLALLIDAASPDHRVIF